MVTVKDYGIMIIGAINNVDIVVYFQLVGVVTANMPDGMDHT